MATRPHQGNLGKRLSEKTLKEEDVFVVDHVKLEEELNSIFNSIAHSDPKVLDKDGNFDANVVPITTSDAVDKEFNVRHELGRVAKGWHLVVPAVVGYSWVGSLYNIRTADSKYLYLAVRAAADLNRLAALIVW